MQQRKGVLVRPVERLSAEQIKMIDKASMAILDDPGIICYSDIAAGYFSDNGANRESTSRTPSAPTNTPTLPPPPGRWTM